MPAVKSHVLDHAIAIRKKSVWLGGQTYYLISQAKTNTDILEVYLNAFQCLSSMALRSFSNCMLIFLLQFRMRLMQGVVHSDEWGPRATGRRCHVEWAALLSAACHVDKLFAWALCKVFFVLFYVKGII